MLLLLEDVAAVVIHEAVSTGNVWFYLAVARKGADALELPFARLRPRLAQLVGPYREASACVFGGSPGGAAAAAAGAAAAAAGVKRQLRGKPGAGRRAERGAEVAVPPPAWPTAEDAARVRALPDAFWPPWPG